MIECSFLPKKIKWEGLCQISNVAGNASVIEEHTRFVRHLSGNLVGVHGIWPKLKFWGGAGNRAQSYTKPTHHLDNVEEKCKELGINFLQCKRFMFSGAQYNMGLNFAHENFKDIDTILWLEGDECLNLTYFDVYKDVVDDLKRKGYDALIFPDLIELGPNRKWFMAWQTNQGFFFNNGIHAIKGTAFDGQQKISTKGLKIITSKEIGLDEMVNVVHLHIFKLYGLCRVKNNLWHGGNKVLSYDRDIGDDLYLNFLYDNLDIKNVDRKDKVDGYIGSTIYNK